MPLGHAYNKLNTDGVAKDNPRPAIGSGLIQDSIGVWIIGFVVHIGFCSLVAAKFWVLLLAQEFTP